MYIEEMKVYIKYDAPETGTEALDSLALHGLRNLLEKEKYRTMWVLRSLEIEITESGGMIIIQQDGRIQTKDFNRELTEKIHAQILNSTD